MTTTNAPSSTEDKYLDAVQSLKQLNEELFYSELKQLIKDREATILAMNEKVYDSIDGMQKKINRVPKLLVDQFQTEVIGPQSEMFDQSIENLQNAQLFLQNSIAQWNTSYQDYLKETQQIIEELKETQKQDQVFVEAQTAVILGELENKVEIADQRLTEEAAKIESAVEQLSLALDAKIQSLDHSVNQVILSNRNHWEEWDAKWSQAQEEAKANRKLVKGFLFGLAGGLGVVIALLVAGLLI